MLFQWSCGGCGIYQVQNEDKDTYNGDGEQETAWLSWFGSLEQTKHADSHILGSKGFIPTKTKSMSWLYNTWKNDILGQMVILFTRNKKPVDLMFCPLNWLADLKRWYVKKKQNCEFKMKKVYTEAF